MSRGVGVGDYAGLAPLLRYRELLVSGWRI